MSGQLGLKTEAAWGTIITPTIFVPVLSARLNDEDNLFQSQGIRAGRRMPNPGRLGRRVTGGTVEMEVYNGSIATILNHAFGTVSTTGAGPYTHAYSPGGNIGKSLTIQTGVEDESGTVDPFTAAGAKFESFRIGVSVSDTLAKLGFDFVSKDIVTATALASASYSSGLTPFSFVEAAVTVNGSPVASANAVTITCTKGMRNDRHVLGSRLIREQREQGKWEVATEITSDFEGLTLHNLKLAGTQVGAVFTLSNGVDSLTITTSGQIVGNPPSLENQGIEPQTIRIAHSHATSDASAFSASLVDSEASAA